MYCVTDRKPKASEFGKRIYIDAYQAFLVNFDLTQQQIEIAITVIN